MKTAYKETVNLLRMKYPRGTSINVLDISDKNSEKEVLSGVVDLVDDAGLIHVVCDNPQKQAIVSWIDENTKIIKEKCYDNF